MAVVRGLIEPSIIPSDAENIIFLKIVRTHQSLLVLEESRRVALQGQRPRRRFEGRKVQGGDRLYFWQRRQFYQGLQHGHSWYPGLWVGMARESCLPFSFPLADVLINSGQIQGLNPTTKRLEIATTPNQDPLLTLIPLIGVDIWEHAFYLQYLNVKVDVSPFISTRFFHPGHTPLLDR